ncbi:MAG: alanine--tRNA ligase, partial [Prevotella sp.]|nr:alanine--tRNA ligase [Prevotella sp.]
KDLYVTVFEGSPEENIPRDDEAAAFWAKHVPADHIINGNKHDNFWEMGDTGPCGPCSEIHLDSRTEEEKAQVAGRDLVNKDNPQVIEIWNLVFMQFNRKADGSLEKLSMNVIDTGMGFERLVRALQGKHSNYDTDVFQPMIKEIEKFTGLKYGSSSPIDIAMRVIADHIRAVSFSIADGQLPGNAKAGYVIRRILRRAVRYAYTFLEQKEAFLFKLVPMLVHEMGDAYPELKAQRELITRVIKEEEDSFLRTLDRGIRMLDGSMAALKAEGKTQLDGSDAFKLFDTYGFPLDLTELICRENGLTVDEEGFNTEMQKQKERARNAAAVENGDWIVVGQSDETSAEQQFVGYDYSEYECHIMRYRQVTQKKNTYYELVLDYTPFYGEMGGQVGDQGVLVSEDETVEIIDTKRENGQSIHIVKQLPKNIEADFMACVDTDKREACAANHTATHLLDYALKQVLGDHVEQKGSFVSPNTLRFDFSHFQKVTDEEIRKVERLVNDMIRQDICLQEFRETPIEEARKLGAIALFGEKYGDKVRVVKFGPSVEFCGGIHAHSTGHIGMFKIVNEASIAAGIRRIEAKTGKECEELMYNMEDGIRALKALFNNAKDLEGTIQKYIVEHDELRKQVEKFTSESVERFKEKLLANPRIINGVKVYSAVLPVKPETAKDIVFKVRAAEPESSICVIGSTSDNRPMLNVIISEDLVKDHGLNAGQLVR